MGAQGDGAVAGVVFPFDEKGVRSSTHPAMTIWQSAFLPANKELAEQIGGEQNWRKNYDKHLVPLTELSMSTPAVTVECAKAGLKAVHEQMEFVREGKATLKIEEAMKKSSYPEVPKTATVTSDGKAGVCDPSKAFAAPLNGSLVSGASLVQAVEERCERGELEPDVVAAFKELDQRKTEWRSTLAKDTVFVILGATSELCPLHVLLSMGLNVVGIARPNQKRQLALLEAARGSPSGGSLTVPILGSSVPDSQDLASVAACCGADIITHAPEVKNWLLELFPGKRMVIGSYIYLDGADHVRASVAMDSVIAGVIAERSDVHIAYLGTPGVVYPIPAAAAEDSERRRADTPWWHSLTGLALGPYVPNTSPAVTVHSINPAAKNQSRQFHVYNGISNVQGPNYMLAKTLQNWRAIVAREVDRRIVSVNMTPMCSTDSVMHVASVARAVRGMPVINAPTVAYEPAAARALMAMLLVFDLCSPDSEANPSVPLRNPMEIFAMRALHGGIWRCPYSGESVGKSAYVLDLVGLS